MSTHRRPDCPSIWPKHVTLAQAHDDATRRNHSNTGRPIRGRWFGRMCPFCTGEQAHAVVIPISKRELRGRNPRLRARFDRAAAARAAKAA